MPRPCDTYRLIYHASRLLFAGAPSALLAEMASREQDRKVAKATAKSWRQGRRRAPLSVLRLLRQHLQAHAAACYTVYSDLEREIARREGEPRRVPRGFMVVR